MLNLELARRQSPLYGLGLEFMAEEYISKMSQTFMETPWYLAGFTKKLQFMRFGGSTFSYKFDIFLLYASSNHDRDFQKCPGATSLISH